MITRQRILIDREPGQEDTGTKERDKDRDYGDKEEN